MDKEVSRLIDQYKFPERAGYYLDSIAWQVREANVSPATISSGFIRRGFLEPACEIASRYNDPVIALGVMDKALRTYFQRMKNNKLAVGSLQELNETERAIASKGNDLFLDFFGYRIEECLLGITGKGGQPAKRKSVPKEPSSSLWENAVRALEDNVF